MAGEESQNYPFSPELAKQLREGGHLSEEFMARTYGNLAQEQAADEDNVKQVIADDFSQKIKSDPNIADIAQRIYENTIGTPEASAQEMPPAEAKKAELAQMFGDAPQQVQPAAVQPQVESPGLANQIGQGVGAAAHYVKDNILMAPVQAVEGAAQGLSQIAAPLVQGINQGYTGEQPAQAAPAAQQPVVRSDYAAAPQENLAPATTPLAEQAASEGSTFDVKKEYQNLYGDVEKAYAHAGATANAGAGQVAASLAEGQNSLEGLAIENAARIKRDEEAFKAQQMKIDKAYDDISKEGINPERWWQNQSTFGKVSSVLAVFMGGLKLRGDNTPNEALGIIDKAIDQDIMAQKAAIELKKFGVQGQENLLERMISKTNSITQAEQLTRAILADSINAKVEMAKVSAQNAGTQANLQLGLQKYKLAAMQAAYKAGALDINMGAGIQDAAQIPDVPAGFNAAVWNATKDRKKMGTAMPGVGVVNPGASTKVFQDISRIKGNLTSVNQKFDHLIQGAEAAGPRITEYWQRPGDAGLKGLHGVLIGDLARMESQTGSVTKHLVDLVKSEIGDDPVGGGLPQILKNKTSGENQYAARMRQIQKAMNEESIARILPALVYKDPSLFATVAENPMDKLKNRAVSKSRAVGLEK